MLWPKKNCNFFLAGLFSSLFVPIEQSVSSLQFLNLSPEPPPPVPPPPVVPPLVPAPWALGAAVGVREAVAGGAVSVDLDNEKCSLEKKGSAFLLLSYCEHNCLNLFFCVWEGSYTFSWGLQAAQKEKIRHFIHCNEKQLSLLKMSLCRLFLAKKGGWKQVEKVWIRNFCASNVNYGDIRQFERVAE